MSNCKRYVPLAKLLMIACLLPAACGPTAADIPVTQPAATPVPVIVQPTAEAALSEQEVATLNSLEKVDDFPLYTMHYYGSSEPGSSGLTDPWKSAEARLLGTWSCSLFAALGGAGKYYGRNFDWVNTPKWETDVSVCSEVGPHARGREASRPRNRAATEQHRNGIKMVSST